MTRYTIFDKIQRAFVAIIDERATKAGFSRREFAFKVWPEAPKNTAENRWNALRNKAWITGKPQGLLLADAFRMAEALNENATYLIGLAAERAAVEARPEETF